MAVNEVILVNDAFVLSPPRNATREKWIDPHGLQRGRTRTSEHKCGRVIKAQFIGKSDKPDCLWHCSVPVEMPADCATDM